MVRFQAILFCTLFVFSGTLFAIGQDRPVKLVTGMGETFTRLEFQGKQFHFDASVEMAEIDASGNTEGFLNLSIPGFYSQGRVGEPSLPESSQLFEAGLDSQPRIVIERMDSVVFNLSEAGVSEWITPYTPSVRKGGSQSYLVVDSALYGKDEWFGRSVLTVEYEGRMRGLSMSRLIFSPVKYNPHRNLLKVYYHIEAKIETGSSPQVRTPYQQPFSSLFNRVVRQDGQVGLKAVKAEEPMTLVIVSDSVFSDSLQNYIAWKTKKGFRVVEAYTQDTLVGKTRESITTYLKNLYLDPPAGIAPPSFLLIVGDVEHVPLSQASGEITDLYYAEYDGGGDFIPELFYGRISVKSTSQLQNVISKILEYEQYLFPDPAFLDRNVLIAGVDGSYASTFGNGQINYAHDYYLNEQQGYLTHMFRYPESDTSAEAIKSLISEGVGLVNYTGHGDWDEWIDPAFRISDIDQLQNEGMYPVMIGNGCQTNYFTASECFAEALIRAPQKGALAYIGCTNDSYWDEDFYWAVGLGPVSASPVYEETSWGYFDKVFHTHDEAYEIWSPTLGEMIFGGNMAVQESSSSRKKFYWEIYQLAGDPTIMPWFGQPDAQEITFPKYLPPGTRRLDLKCLPYSYLAVSQNGILLDAKHAGNSGLATLWIPDTIRGGTINLVVTADQTQPFTGKIEVGTPEGAYLDLLEYSIGDESVEDDHHISPGERSSLDMTLMNRGGEAITNDTLLLFSSEECIEILDSLYIIKILEPGDTLDLSGIFRISSSLQLEDQSTVVMGFLMNGSEFPFYIEERLYAPVITSGGIVWDDRSDGNGNGIIEEGEWLECSWHLSNSGHFRTGAIEGNVLAGNPILMDQVIFRNNPAMEPGDSAVLIFDVKVGYPGKGLHDSGLLSATDSMGMVTDNFSIRTGRYFEDFNNGNTDRFPFNNGSLVPWKPDQSILERNSLRSGKISHGAESIISLQFETSEDDSLSFSYRVSSESYFDFLIFVVDSTETGRWSGETGWSTFPIYMEAGKHEISWRYQKDSNTSRGEDAAWIDDIVFPNTAFRKGDLSVMGIFKPESGPWLTSAERVGINVTNLSDESVPGFAARFYLDGNPVDLVQYDEPLSPGKSVAVSSGNLLDLSDFGSHTLKAVIESDSTGYSGNNSIEKSVIHQVYPDLSLSLVRIDHQSGIRADAIVRVENAGNIPLDSFRYKIWIDNQLVRSGTSFSIIDPGQTDEKIFQIVDSADSMDPGQYEFLMRVIDKDSVEENNEVIGLINWYSLDVPADRFSQGWRVFPNPSKTGVHVTLESEATEDMLFELISLSGRVTDSFVITKGSDQGQLPTINTGSGTYLLKLVNSGESALVVILP